MSNLVLEMTREFWNRFPCDSNSTYLNRAKYRYGKEPWLLQELSQIAREHSSIVEIGCGQGTDALTLCCNMSKYGSYLGIDYSDESINLARESARTSHSMLSVIPKFQIGNAEALPFESDSLECIYSMGVIHHTPNTQEAINEIFRVLKPGGKAYIIVYRTFSPKLLVAHCLRGMQGLIDKIFRKDKVFLGLFSLSFFEGLFGTAIQECFGVPILKSYTAGRISNMFKHFKIESMLPMGLGLPPMKFNHLVDKKPTIFGYFWYLKLKK